MKLAVILTLIGVCDGFTQTSGAACLSGADCGQYSGVCSTIGCQCFRGFTCPDCTKQCEGAWPSQCKDLVCPTPLARGGAACVDCTDCFNCNGGACFEGTCQCFDGFGCGHCEWNTQRTGSPVCTFQPVNRDSGSAGKKGGLNGGQWFGVAFGGGVFVLLAMLCLCNAQRSNLSNRKSTQATEAKEAQVRSVVVSQSTVPTVSASVVQPQQQMYASQQFAPQFSQQFAPQPQQFGYPPPHTSYVSNSQMMRPQYVPQ
eukprot:c32917_g1_i1.p1 GENE.c32917_g1_i1~~c32917_g1_i1.p1  ORF type:complete len:272 (+),score=27.74 c32917_g1_i1:46-816(+)